MLHHFISVRIRLAAGAELGYTSHSEAQGKQVKFFPIVLAKKKRRNLANFSSVFILTRNISSHTRAAISCFLGVYEAKPTVNLAVEKWTRGHADLPEGRPTKRCKVDQCSAIWFCWWCDTLLKLKKPTKVNFSWRCKNF
jgi:hypothetical protein